jgi:hypothetical protein
MRECAKIPDQEIMITGMVEGEVAFMPGKINYITGLA